MSKKSRKLKKIAAAAAERKSVLGLKKTGGKVKKEALVKALSESSVSVIAPPVGNNTGKKKKRRHSKMAADPKVGVEQKGVASGALMNQHTEQTQKGNVSLVKESGKSKKKRKRNRKKGISSESSSADQKIKGSITAVSNSNGSVKESRKSQRRRNRKRKAAQEVAGISEPVVKSVKPPKKVKMEEASSDSEPELIHADWRLANDSSDEGGSKAESDSESDLDVSEEDVDEEPPHLDEGADDSDVNVEIEGAIRVVNKNDLKESESGYSAKNPNLEIKKSVEEKSEVNELDGKTQSSWPNNKKFSLSDKAAILKEIQERAAEFDSRCLYVAPIPGDCTFDMLKKFIPKMKSCRFFTRPKSNKLRTFVFVEFADAETAGKEKLSISGRLFAGQSMRAETRSSQQHGDKRVTNGVHSPENIDFSRILIKGLAPGVNQTDLKSIFPTAETIRLPTSPHNFNYGYAILKYVSDAVALDAFSQCHGLLLKGHPVSVNFAFKPSEKKPPASAATAPPSKPNMLIRPQEETQPAKHVGKVVIQPMVNARNAEGGGGLTKGFTTSESLKPTRIQQHRARNSGEKEGISKDEGTKEKLAVGEARGDDVARAQPASFLSEMIKQAKKVKDEEVIEVESDEGGENSGDEKDVKVEGNSEEEEGDEDGSDEEDGTDEGESDGEDEIEEVSGVSASGSDDDDSRVEEVGMPAGDDSEGETIDASLAEVLKARRTCAKALKSPGAKRNWKATVGKKRPDTTPKILPVPKKIRK